MLARVITLRFDPLTGNFDDGPLREFLKDKEVLSIRDHFFVKNEIPYLAVLVTYYPHTMEAAASTARPRSQRDASWRELVTDENLPLFNTLRDWRAERSKQEGIPPYVICTNRQFAAMVKSRPQSLAALAEVDGFGKAKLEKYGQEILAILAAAPAASKAPDRPAQHEESEDVQPQG